MSLIVDMGLQVDFDDDMNITGGRPPVRYIKLGANNAWARQAFQRNEIPFSFREVPHDLASTLDEKRIAQHLIGLGKAVGAATSAARQVCSFYGLGRDCIWITFADGLMWFTEAEQEVEWLGESDDYAPRIRRTRGGWSSCNRFEVPFYINGLSSRLTKVASTHTTICRIEAEDYVLRKICSCQEPSTIQAGRARAGVQQAIETLIQNLHWTDFETLVDLLLARSGWHRVSALGGNMKDVDIVVEQAITKEVAFVQVKSASSQKELDHYISIYDANPGFSRMIFACHSPITSLESGRPDVLIWARSALSDLVFRNGLFDWLIERTA